MEVPIKKLSLSPPTVAHGNAKEEILKNIPKSLGKRVTTTLFLDANLLHGIVTWKSVTAVLHFVNTMPKDWYLKRQATVETATYGSKFVAAKAAKEQIIDLRNTLRYLGFPLSPRQTCLVTISQLSQAQPYLNPYSTKDIICCHITE